MLNKILILNVIVISTIIAFIFFEKNSPNQLLQNLTNKSETQDEGGLKLEPYPLSIESLQTGEYPGSDLAFEQTLDPGSNYDRYITSYKSEGLKIYALLTIPTTPKPQNGFPVIIFNHGFIQPAQYRTTERYVAYQDAFARNGYITIKSDYRGHGNSEGEAGGGYGSNSYTIDVLNAISSVKRLKDLSNVNSQTLAPRSLGEVGSIVDPERIGMWGHSMGGFITLRSMVTTKDIKVGVIWGGVVASYPDLLKNWRRGNQANPSPSPLPGGARRWRQALVEQFGEPEQNPQFWSSISANSYLTDISGPVQLHHGGADTSVPVEFSQKLYEQLKAGGHETEIYTYPDDDHNISSNLSIALERSVEYFDKYLK